MACNYCFPTRTTFQINSESWKEGIFRWENHTSCLVGLKTHPTIVPRSGIELTHSRLHSFIMAKVSHALNHSAMEAELTTSRLHSFIMAKVSHALNHSAIYNYVRMRFIYKSLICPILRYMRRTASGEITIGNQCATAARYTPVVRCESVSCTVVILSCFCPFYQG